MDGLSATQSAFIARLSEIYDAPPAFVRLYLEQQGVDGAKWPSADDWRNSLQALSRHYTDYALGTNQRARATVNECIARHGGAPKRHLDIGAGQGGLCREFSKRGAKSTGIEIVPNLHRLASTNTSDVGATIINASILDVDHKSLGQFDVITCTEVIEHVKDPEELVRRIADLLAPGGTLFLRMPNARHTDSVRADGHFLQFGMALLSRQEARGYKDVATGVADDYAHMGEYYSQNFYSWLLRKAGLSHEIVLPAKPLGEYLDEFPEKMNAVMAAYVDWKKNVAPRLPYFQKQRIEVAVSRYTADAFAAHADALLGKGAYEFVLDYCISFWSFVARRAPI